MTYIEKYDLITNAIRKEGNRILPKGARIVLYGSRARGDYKLDSDWDIHIVIPGETVLRIEDQNQYIFPFDMIGWEYGEAISTAVYSSKDWERRKHHPYYENVERDKIILFEKI